MTTGDRRGRRPSGDRDNRLRPLLRKPIIVGALMLAAMPLVGAQCDTGGIVGSSDDAPIASAAVNAQRLCHWELHTDLNNDNGTWVRGKASCGTNRQVYQTCNVSIFASATGFGVYSAVDHGTNACNAFRRADCPDCWQARGAQFKSYYRLDNPDRRWRTGFVEGDGIYCDFSFNGNGQHIMGCLTWHGNPPIGCHFPYPEGTCGVSRAANVRPILGRVRSACASGHGTLGDGECAAASERAKAKLLKIPAVRRWARNQLFPQKR